MRRGGDAAHGAGRGLVGTQISPLPQQKNPLDLKQGFVRLFGLMVRRMGVHRHALLPAGWDPDKLPPPPPEKMSGVGGEVCARVQYSTGGEIEPTVRGAGGTNPVSPGERPPASR